MRKIFLPLIVSAVALLAPSIARAGVVSITISTPGEIDLKVGDTATIDYQGNCNLGAGNNGTLHLFAIENPSVDLVPAITIPDTSGTSGQFSGSVTYTFTATGTVTVDAKITGSLGGSCDVSSISPNTINFSITESDPTTTTTQPTVGFIAQTGSSTTPLVIAGLVAIACGVIFLSRDRLVHNRRTN